MRAPCLNSWLSLRAGANLSTPKFPPPLDDRDLFTSIQPEGDANCDELNDV